MSNRYALGFIGAGNMAQAIARGAIEKGVMSPQQMIASDTSKERLMVFARMRIKVVDQNAYAIPHCEQIMLAVKPQVFPDVAGELAEHGREEQVLISIMAGIGSQKIAEAVGRPARVVRVMPNTPMMVGLGMSGLAVGQHAQAGDEALAMKLFGAAGEVVRVEEKLMDVVTAVSGSGPAYVYYLAEAMQRAAQDMGLGEDARLFVAQTLIGAARMLMESPDSAADLRRKVTSPGGTTAAAIEHMESNRVGQIITDAVKAAEARGKALGR